MKSGKITFIITALSCIAGVIVCLVEVGGLGGVLFALLLLAVPAGLYVWFFRPLWLAEGVAQRGKPAEATVLKVWDTGWTINDDPQVGLLLEVRPPGEEPFRVQTKSVIPRLAVAAVRPGAVLRVRYDPQDRRRVVVPAVEVEQVTRGAAERLAELEGLRQQGLVTEEEYQRKRKEILDAV